MHTVGKYCFCVFILTLGACKKDSEVADQEIREAGYSMTHEGWLDAIRANDPEVVKKMVKSGFDLKVQDENGRGSMHVAAEAGAVEVADYFLSSGISIDQADFEGKTPLMLASMAGRHEMMRWLLKQGANPNLKDKNGYMAMMLAVTHHQTKSIEELAPYHREDLDSALLLASLVGGAASIDTLTNYGASVHARMEDGRTPLMLAAENGHQEAVSILLDLGASRHASTENGDTARSIAVAAGHGEIAEMLEKGVSQDTIGLDDDQEIAANLKGHLDGPDAGATASSEIRLFDGAKISKPTQGSDANSSSQQTPLIMRHYSQRELPLEVKAVSGETATLEVKGKQARAIKVRSGDPIPDSDLVVVKVSTRVEVGKLNNNQPMRIGVVEVRDKNTGKKREWHSGKSVVGHDPVAVVEDGVSGQRYLAKAGQKFTSEDGREFVVSDVRPGQVVIEDVNTGEAETLFLRGPKG
jgi:ankyrin repeat protein